jgi:hypothetical protein
LFRPNKYGEAVQPGLIKTSSLIMEQIQHLSEFFEAINKDPKIGPIHIGLYAALLHFYVINGYTNPICAYSYEIMKLVKVSGRCTYVKCINELAEWGYLSYHPTRKRMERSLIYLKV